MRRPRPAERQLGWGTWHIWASSGGPGGQVSPGQVVINPCPSSSTTLALCTPGLVLGAQLRPCGWIG